MTRKQTFLIPLFLGLMLLANPKAHLPSAQNTNADRYAFKEVWGYVMKGEETFLSNSMPFTDIGYFSSKVEDDGTLTQITRPDLKGEFDRSHRIHLVVSMIGSKMLTHFVLREDLPFKKKMVLDIAQMAADFDGVQIDFESLRYEDRDLYLKFLKDVRAVLPKNKIFSVAVPARWWEKDNAFNYVDISAIVDRVIVMAYDEHWRTGEAGPIASLPWCKKVLDYAQKRIPPEKLVMGLPLYGRAWQVENYAQALRYPQAIDLCQKISCDVKMTETGEPFFEYQIPATVKVYFEDRHSLINKISLYQKNSVPGVAFWRVGQEPKDLWTQVRTK